MGPRAGHRRDGRLIAQRIAATGASSRRPGAAAAAAGLGGTPSWRRLLGWEWAGERGVTRHGAAGAVWRGPRSHAACPPFPFTPSLGPLCPIPAALHMPRPDAPLAEPCAVAMALQQRCAAAARVAALRSVALPRAEHALAHPPSERVAFGRAVVCACASECVCVRAGERAVAGPNQLLCALFMSTFHPPCCWSPAAARAHPYPAPAATRRLSGPRLWEAWTIGARRGAGSASGPPSRLYVFVRLGGSPRHALSMSCLQPGRYWRMCLPLQGLWDWTLPGEPTLWVTCLRAVFARPFCLGMGGQHHSNEGFIVRL
jgi:hypothetical protein